MVTSSVPPSPYQKPLKSVRPPLIPSEYEPDKQEEGFFGSLGKLLANTGASMVEIIGGLFPSFRRKSLRYQFQRQPLIQQPQKQVNAWPVQESFVIPDEDQPSSKTPCPQGVGVPRIASTSDTRIPRFISTNCTWFSSCA